MRFAKRLQEFMYTLKTGEKYDRTEIAQALITQLAACIAVDHEKLGGDLDETLNAVHAILKRDIKYILHQTKN